MKVTGHFDRPPQFRAWLYRRLSRALRELPDGMAVAR